MTETDTEIFQAIKDLTREQLINLLAGIVAAVEPENTEAPPLTPSVILFLAKYVAANTSADGNFTDE